MPSFTQAVRFRVVPAVTAIIAAVITSSCADSTGPDTDTDTDTDTSPPATMTALTSETSAAPGTMIRFRAGGFTVPTDSLSAVVGTQTTWLYRDAATADEFVFIVPAVPAGAAVLRFPTLRGTPEWRFTVTAYTPVADPAAEVASLANALAVGIDSVLADDVGSNSLALQTRLTDIAARLPSLTAAQAAQVAYLVRSNRVPDTDAALASVFYANCSAGLAELSLRKSRLIKLALQTGIGVLLLELPTGITQIAGGLLLVEAVVNNRTFIKEMPGIITAAFDACWTRRTLWEIVGPDGVSAPALQQPAAVGAGVRLAPTVASNTAPVVFLNDVPRDFAVRARYNLSDEAFASLAGIDSLVPRLREFLPDAWVDAITDAMDLGPERTRAEPAAGIELRDISSPLVLGSLATTDSTVSLRFRLAAGAPQTPVEFTYRLVDATRGLDLQRSAVLESAADSVDWAISVLNGVWTGYQAEPVNLEYCANSGGYFFPPNFSNAMEWYEFGQRWALATWSYSCVDSSWRTRTWRFYLRWTPDEGWVGYRRTDLGGTAGINVLEFTANTLRIGQLIGDVQYVEAFTRGGG